MSEAQNIDDWCGPPASPEDFEKMREIARAYARRGTMAENRQHTGDNLIPTFTDMNSAAEPFTALREQPEPSAAEKVVGALEQAQDLIVNMAAHICDLNGKIIELEKDRQRLLTLIATNDAAFGRMGNDHDGRNSH